MRKPPWILARILDRIVDRRVSYDALGEFEERFYSVKESSGYSLAVLWYLAQIILSIPDYLIYESCRSTVMFKNYLKIAIRSLIKNKFYSFINILGLSIGIAGVILIFLFIVDEASFDRFHLKSDRLYRLTTNVHHPDGSVNWNMGIVVFPHGPEMEEFFPDVLDCVRTYQTQLTMKYENSIENLDVLLVDPDFFTMFSFPLIAGSSEHVLDQPNSIILSETYARKYFGNSDPVGEIITLISGEFKNDFIVTGITKDAPPNSTIQYNILIPIESMRSFGMERRLELWMGWHGKMQTYVELKDKNSYSRIIERYDEFGKKFYSSTFDRMRRSLFDDKESKSEPLSFDLQRMSDIHLDRYIDGSPDLTNIYILSGIALGIMLIACINFITQSLGLASRRGLEVGMRKVVGARKHQLVRQFLTESVVITLSAAIFGILFSLLAIPVFNELSEKSLTTNGVLSFPGLIFIFSLLVVTGIVAGSYPAFIISKFRPIEIFRGRLSLTGRNIITKVLVIAQFACSVFLIISTIILGRQIDFMIHTNPGFDRQNIIIIRTQVNNFQAGEAFYDTYKERISQFSGVLSITGANSAFELSNLYNDVKTEEKNIFTKTVRTKFDYFKTLGIEVSEGRDFSRKFPSDKSGVIVNEAMVRELGLEDPVGKQLEGFFLKLNIIGVIKDFFTENMRGDIPPTLYYLNPVHNINFVIVRISEEKISESLDFMKKSWEELQPDKPFTYSFLDEEVAKSYSNEQKWKGIVQYSTGFAVLIACLGVFGMISITIDSRIREVSIRKIHGAKINGLIMLLSGESIKLVLAANIMAWPAVWYTMNRWLENYAYRIDISISIFLYAALTVMILVFLTISYQVIQAARANPVDMLRYE